MNVHDAVHVPWPAELQQEIQKESAKYIRHSLRSASATPGQALSAKDAAIPQIISAHYAEIDRLAAEKEVLAERMVQLIMRARARLDYDLNKVLVLQGELDPSLQAGCYLSAKNPADKINESLRNAIAIPEAPASPAVSSAPAQKRAWMSVSFTHLSSDSLCGAAFTASCPGVSFQLHLRILVCTYRAASHDHGIRG